MVIIIFIVKDKLHYLHYVEKCSEWISNDYQLPVQISTQTVQS